MSFKMSETHDLAGAIALRASAHHERKPIMLRWAVVFAILALVAGLLGFVGLQGDFAYIAKILLFVFLVLFVISLIFGRGSPPAV
jgi:uncharacterized membrane protein YtjA (UPF0391 family)